MIPVPGWLLAEHVSVEHHRFARLQSMTEWWHWLLLLVVMCAIATYVLVMYWRDSRELTRGVSCSLVLLRLLAFGGILFFFLGLEKRTETHQPKNSRVMLMVDTSLSMGMRDRDATSVPAGPARIDQVVSVLQQGSFLQQLRQQHDVVAYRFDQEQQPTEIATFPRLSPQSASGNPVAEATAQRERLLTSARTTAFVGLGLAGLGILALGWHLLAGRLWATAESGSWGLLVFLLGLISGGVVLATADLRCPEWGLPVILGLAEPPPPDTASTGTHPAETPATPTVNWPQELRVHGTATRLGDTLRFLVNRERGGPISGIVIATDGGSNAGIDCSVAQAAAQQAGIPIYPIGLGSDKRPLNVRVVDLEAPKRVFPGDKFSLTGYVQAFGLEGRNVKLELSSAMQQGNAPPHDRQFEEEQHVRLGKDGEVVQVKFEVTPNEPGRRVFALRAVDVAQDLEPGDNEKTAPVEVVERKSRVLLFAGGPTREYAFLRNQLYRDKETTVDVLLQSAQEGISQEADDILSEFPSTAAELFEYDCIIAFDPDWTQLDDQQVELLERWVAEKAGGLVVIAGPVNTPEWSAQRRGRDHRVDVIKGLYPVVFYSQGTSVGLDRFGGESPWPLAFTREGLESEQLWLEDNAIGSEEAWRAFSGVYGYYAVKDPKPGAHVYARFSDPDTAIDNTLPIYLASQFYGAGRVVFQASGEMWRLRSDDEAYFERYYTKLIRWVSQGRLLRDSSRGLLLVDRDRCLLGDTVVVQTMLSDAQFRPLKLDEVTATLVQPDTTRVSLVMRPVKDAAREGFYAAQFNAQQEGDYRIELTPPGAAGDELLSTQVRVRVPALELERPERNDPLLRELADATGGAYYVGVDAATARDNAARPPLVNLLEPRDQETILPGTPDRRFDRQLMGWLMALMCGVLSLEWLLRRLGRLA